MIELIIVLAIVGIVAAFAAAYLRSISKRERLKSAAKEVLAVVVAARAQALQLKQTCVLLVDPASRRITVWADALPHNYVQDSTEPTLIQFQIPATVVFRLAPNGDAVNGPDAIAFDGYLGNPALVDRIVFNADGSLDPPEAANSQRPLRPVSFTAKVPAGSINCNPGQHCRGIYISDNALSGDVANRNAFRVSVDENGPMASVSLLKWLPSGAGSNRGETNYVPPPWRWVD
jgi:type II secretory pathway pseudopilin PulG